MFLYYLKERILSDEGHLSNNTTARYLSKLVGEKMGATVFVPKDDNGLKGAPTDVFTNMENNASIYSNENYVK